jgi:beta-galactosidase/beta-glucuronidase
MFLPNAHIQPQRWYARDAASAVQRPQQEQEQQQQQQLQSDGSSPAAAAFTGYVASLDVDVPAALAAAGSSHQLQLWSAECPDLYLLVLKLSLAGQVLEVEGCQVGELQGEQGDLLWVGGGTDTRTRRSRVKNILETKKRKGTRDWGRPIQHRHLLLLLLHSLQVGFRCTRVSGGQLLHNNAPLLLRGVNRHEWHDRWGE